MILQPQQIDFEEFKPFEISDNVILPHFSDYANNLQFSDSIEENLFHQARMADEFLMDFEAEDKMNFHEPLHIDQVAFLVIGSSKKRTFRLLSQYRSWLSMTRHFFLIAGEPIDNLPNVIVINSNSPNSPITDSLIDSGEILWRSILWMKENQPKLLAKLKWITIVADDTWLNIPKLLDFLSNYNHNYNLAIGQVSHNFLVQNRTFLQGRSGIIFSQRAFSTLTEHLFKPYCRYNKPHGDLSLWSCYKVAGTLLVHSYRFHQWSVDMEKLWRYYVLMPNFYTNEISYSYMNNHLVKLKMTCDSAYYWGFEEPQDCEDLKRVTNGSLYLELAATTNLKYEFLEETLFDDLEVTLLEQVKNIHAVHNR